MKSHQIKYWIKARHRKGHGVHSPFTFMLVREVLYNCYGNYSVVPGEKKANAILFSLKKHTRFLMRLNLFLKEKGFRRVDFKMNEAHYEAIRRLRRDGDWERFWEGFVDDQGNRVRPDDNKQCWVFHRPYANAETRWLIKTLFKENRVDVGINLRRIWLGFKCDTLQHQQYTILI